MESMEVLTSWYHFAVHLMNVEVVNRSEDDLLREMRLLKFRPRDQIRRCFRAPPTSPQRSRSCHSLEMSLNKMEDTFGDLVSFSGSGYLMGI